MRVDSITAERFVKADDNGLGLGFDNSAGFILGKLF